MDPAIHDRKRERLELLQGGRSNSLHACNTGFFVLLTLALAFNAGGFFPAATGFAAAALAVAMALHVLLVRAPHASLSRGAVAGLAALVAYGCVTFASALWSHSAARAALEFDRTLIYILAFAWGMSIVRSPNRVRWIARSLLVVTFSVAVVGFVARTFPDVVLVEQGFDDSRLNFPMTYWNAMGIFAAIGVILATAIASDVHEPTAVRLFACAAAPFCAATLLLTFARGPLALGAVGVLVVIVVGRQRSSISGLAATVIPAGLAVVAALDAPALASENPTGANAAAQGHALALIVVGLAVLGVALRVVGFRVDDCPGRVRIPGPAHLNRPAAVLLVIGATVALALLSVGPAEDAWEAFKQETPSVSQQGDRLTSLSSNGRIEQWQVALDGFRSAEVLGRGAGTYQLLWEQDRDTRFSVQNAHSLYLENLAELGLVGLIALLIPIGLIVFGVARLVRDPDRIVAAGLLAALLAWLLEAGIDWLWEMPAVSLWVFFLGGSVLASPRPSLRPSPHRLSRVIAALLLLLIALLPMQIAVSETRLTAAKRSFADGDCSQASNESLGSLEAFGGRSEPYSILAYCDALAGESGLAVRMMRHAVANDPANWEYQYGLALVRAAAGEDPMPQLRAAQESNPLEPRVADAREAFENARPGLRRKTALTLRLPAG